MRHPPVPIPILPPDNPMDVELLHTDITYDEVVKILKILNVVNRLMLKMLKHLYLR